MTLTSWLRAVFHRRPKSLAARNRTESTVELALVRLEDRRVLSVSGGDVMLFSIGGPGATLPDVGQVQASDIVSYDGSQFEIVFDGSDVGLSSAAIDAIAWKGENQLLLSFAGNTTIAGLGTFTGSDILQFDANTLGDNTSGTFSLFLRGSNIGLSGTAGNVDALDFLDDGTLVISTQGNVSLPAGPSGPAIALQDEDLLRITPDANGNFAAGTRQLFFDGSDVGLTFSTEQLDAVAINGPEVRFSTSGSFFIESQGLGGSREDVLTFNASSFGENTTGAFVGITFDGSQVLGFGFDLSGLEFATLPARNHLPTASDVAVTTGEDTPAPVQLLGDDGDANQDQLLTYQIVDGPDFGVVTDFDPATGTFNYLPNANFAGTDEILYLVQETDVDGTVSTSGLATVHLTVTAINDAPIALDVLATTAEDQSVHLQLLGDDGERDQVQPLTFHIVDGPDFGAVTGFNPATGTFTYVPNANFSGTDQIVYLVQETDNDGTVVASGLATVQITVTAVNDAPTASDVHVTTTEDSAADVQLVGDGGEMDQVQPLTYHIVDGPDFGVVTGFDPAIGTLTYLPNANFAGIDRIIYLVQETDADGTVFLSEMAAVTLTVTAINDAPVVQVGQSEFTANHGTPVVIHGLSVDDLEAASELQQITVRLQIENGTLCLSDVACPVVVSGDGTSDVLLTGTIADINALLAQGVICQTDAAFSGMTNVVVTVQDGADPNGSLVASATVELNILAPPPPPPPPAPEPPAPPVSFQDRIQQLLDSGELNRNQARVLQKVLKHPDRERLIERAIRRLERWENRGRLDSDLANELTMRLEEILEEAENDGRGRRGLHNIVDHFFEQVGNGRLRVLAGRFRF